MLIVGTMLAMGIVLVPDASTRNAEASTVWRNTGVSMVTVGDAHTCAIQNGVLFCWGAGTQGQLGYTPPPRPPVSPAPADSNTPTRVTPFSGFLNNGNVTTVSAGGATTCAIESGMLFCWGANNAGQMGNGRNTQANYPSKVSSANGFDNNSGLVTHVATGGNVTCAIENGEVFCWGANGLGAVGNGTTTWAPGASGTHPNVPQRVVTNGDFANSGVTAVTVGNTACAIEVGELFCWGAGSSGQMGNGTLNQSNTRPVKVGSGSDGFVNNNVTSVSNVGVSMCGVRLGAMYCWGNLGYGNGGFGVQVNEQSSPRKVSVANGMTNASVTSASVGNAACAVDAGIVYCFGTNGSGQVGDGTTTTRVVPTKVSATGGMQNNGSVTMVAVETDHACAIELGSVFCWGRNHKGQLGNGITGGDQRTPINASSLPGAPTITGATVGTTTATVTVSAGSGAVPTGYTVTAQPGGLTCTVTPPATSCTVAGLTSGTAYTFTAVANTALGNSPASGSVTRTTGAAAVPGDPQVVAGEQQITVTPTPGNGGGTPTGYLVYASPGSGACTVLSPATSCVISPLTNGQPYTVTTAAFNDAGTSGASGGSTVTAGAAAVPDPPIIVVGNRSATVSVSPTTSGGTPAYYTVTASAIGAPPHVVTCTVTPPATSCTVTGLTNGRDYTFTTSATNGGGTSSTTTPITRLVDVLPIPLTPSVTLSTNGVTVSVATDPSGGTTQRHVVYMMPGDRTCTVTPPATTCFISPLTNPTTYTVTTAAINDVGTSSASPAHVFDFAQPGVPQIGVLSIASTSATVTVSAGTPGGQPNTYQVYVGPGTCSIVVPATSCTVTGLTPGQTYTATASATNVLGTATNSGGTPVLVTPPDPPTPGSVVVGHQSATVTVNPATSGGKASQYTVTASAVNDPTDVRTCTFSPPATNCTVTGLTNGRTYEFSTGASNVHGSALSGATTSALVDALPVPLAPVIDVRSQTLEVFVSASSLGGSVDNYTVYVEPGGFTCTVLRPTSSSCTIPGPSDTASLSAGTLYRVTTTATNTIGTSGSSPSTSAWFDPPSIPSIGGLTLGTTSVTVSVVPGPALTSGPASFYTVTAMPGGRTCTVTPPATTCALDPLTPGLQYTVTVSATNGKGVSGASDPATARLILPDTPFAPVVQVLEPGVVSVMVIPPEPPEIPTTYTVITTTSAGPGPSCVITPPEVLCTIQGLSNNTSYIFSTVVTNQYGSSPTGSATTAIIAEPPTPFAPSVVPGNGQATVTVNPGTGGGVPSVYVVNADPDGSTCEVTPPATSCVLEGLTNGTPYSVTVLAGNGVGTSTVSAAAVVTPEEPRTLLPPGIGALIVAPVPTNPPSSTVPTTVPPSTTVPPTTTVPPPVPADPDTGALPDLSPGSVTVIQDGEPVVAQVEVVGSTEVVVRSDGLELSLSAECTSVCEVTTNAEGQPVIQLEEGGGVRVTGTGFRSGTLAYVWVFSRPRLLGTVTVNADGSFEGSLPLGDLERGEHTLQVVGTSATGLPKAANLGVVVNEAGASTPVPGRLPATGNGGSAPMLQVAIVLVLLGTITLTGRRRSVN